MDFEEFATRLFYGALLVLFLAIVVGACFTIGRGIYCHWSCPVPDTYALPGRC